MKQLDLITTGGDMAASMRRQSALDKKKIDDLGIKSPDLSKSERRQIDNKTIAFKCHCPEHAKTTGKNEIVYEEMCEPIFDEE